MLIRIASLALVAASFGFVTPATAVGQCGGTYDTNCTMYICNRNCLEVRCAVYTDVVPGQQTGCIG